MKKKGMIILFLAVFIVAAIVDILEISQESFTEIQRQEPGQGDEEIELTLNAGKILEDYNYSLNVEEQKVTKEQAEEYFS